MDILTVCVFSLILQFLSPVPRSSAIHPATDWHNNKSTIYQRITDYVYIRIFCVYVNFDVACKYNIHLHYEYVLNQTKITNRENNLQRERWYINNFGKV